MAMHTIEVDDEVMSCLKRKAESFVDSPNSVLRRELLCKEMSARAPGLVRDNLIPDLPAGTPAALMQVLQVVYLVKNSSRPRSDATHMVARKHGIAFQTVLDKYCRQLGLTAEQFDRLLDEKGLKRLSSLLKSRFRRHQKTVDEFLAGTDHGEAFRAVSRHDPRVHS